MVEFIEQRRQEIQRRIERQPHYEWMTPRQREKVARREERREVRRSKRLLKRGGRAERGKPKKEVMVIAEEDEYDQDYDEDDYEDDDEEVGHGIIIKLKINFKNLASGKYIFNDLVAVTKRNRGLVINIVLLFISEVNGMATLSQGYISIVISKKVIIALIVFIICKGLG